MDELGPLLTAAEVAKRLGYSERYVGLGHRRRTRPPAAGVPLRVAAGGTVREPGPRELLERLAARPTLEQWRDAIAAALDDASLRLGYHHPDTGRFLDSDGNGLSRRPPAGTGPWVPVDRGGRAVAAMVVDETLAEDPELVRAAASATLLAVENGDLQGELRASRARIIAAGYAERQRIERDLHDSAQQRLVALRIHLSLAGERLDRSGERATFEDLGAQVDDAIDELRSVARGIYPPVLTDRGVAAALTGSPIARDPRRVSGTSGSAASRRRSRRPSTSAARSACRT